MWLYNSILGFLGFTNLFYQEGIRNMLQSDEHTKGRKKFTISLKKLYVIFAFIPLVFLGSMRSINIGNDTNTYHYIFNMSRIFSMNDFIELNTQRWEKGFLIFTKLLSNLSESPQILIAVSSLISLSLVARFIYKYSKSPALSIFLFVTMRFYFFFMSNIRQSIALSLILLSYDFIKKRKIIPFFLVVLIASQFHSTAILFLPAYFFENLSYSKRNTSILIGITAIFFLGFDYITTIVFTIAPVKYQNYMNTTYFTDSTNLANFANFATTLSILLLGYICKYYRYSDENDVPFIYILISLSLGLLSIRFGMFARVQHYYYLFSIVQIPSIIKKFINANQRMLVVLIVIFCFFLYHNIILMYRPEWQRVYPYEMYSQYQTGY